MVWRDGGYELSQDCSPIHPPPSHCRPVPPGLFSSESRDEGELVDGLVAEEDRWSIRWIDLVRRSAGAYRDFIAGRSMGPRMSNPSEARNLVSDVG